MKPCGAVSALLAAVVACLAYVLLRNSGQQEDSPAPGAYELGSGRMFDAIAPRYDLINKVISLGLDMRWRRAMIDGLELRPGDRVVDMATGTADVAIMIARELAKLETPDSGTVPGTVARVVVGIDPSANMLDVGRQKAKDAGLSSSVNLQIGDAQNLVDIQDGSVDKLTMAFGIRNVPDRLKALKEFRRIMAFPEEIASLSGDDPSSRPSELLDEEGEAGAGVRGGGGSVVAILELQDPESGVLAFASRAFIRYAAPVLGWAMSGSGAEYGHLKDSILRFPSVSEWTELMTEAGFDVFAHQTMGFGTVHLYLARPRAL